MPDTRSPEFAQQAHLDSLAYRLSDEERADLETALEEVARGDLATEEEVEAVFGSPVDNLDKSR